MPYCFCGCWRAVCENSCGKSMLHFCSLSPECLIMAPLGFHPYLSLSLPQTSVENILLRVFMRASKSATPSFNFTLLSRLLAD